MAETLASIVDLIHPTSSGVGVITTDQIFVLFDRAIDETTIAGGNFFVTGPDFDTWLGPDLQLFQEAVSTGGGEKEILQSPGFQGIVQGEISFQRISLTSQEVISGIDTIGSGLLYRTKAIFTPTKRLQANTEYTVYLSGDEDTSDSLKTGISERTVYDPVASGINTGTGDVEFTGGYVGLIPDVYHIDVTVSGEAGDAKFTFYRDSDPSSVFGPFKSKRSGVLLSDGVTVSFDEGLFRVGDHWHVVVKPRNVFQGNLQWGFKTGSGSIQTIPDTTATSVLGDPAPAVTTTSTSSSTSTFGVLSTNPADNASNQAIPAGVLNIGITFNADIDPASVVSGVDISVTSENVDGSTLTPSGLIVEPSVSGNNLTLIVASGQLGQNQLITVTLDNTIQNISGASLDSDYVFSFTTQYYPMYCTERLIRLDIGAYITDVAEDTINFAIWLASLAADEMTWNKDNLDDPYYQFVRQQWTCCKAEEILLINTTGGSNKLKSKKLGDLAVEYDTSGADISIPLQRAMECQMKWEAQLQAGGQARKSSSPQMVVKGELDVDRPPIGRGWVHRRSIHPQTPAANRKLRFQGFRRFRNIYSRRGNWWNK